MIFIGLSWLTFWLLVDVFNVEFVKSALITGIIYLVLGLLYEYGPESRIRRP